jgi:hypothetical protein
MQAAARRQGILSFGASLLANSGPQPGPGIGLGAALGQAIQAGQAANQGSIDNQLQQLLLKSQIQRNERGPAGNGDPALVAEYKFAQANGFQGSFQDYIKSKQTAQQAPSDIQSYEYYSKLTPEQQKQFLEIKRNSQPYQYVQTARGDELLNKVTGDLQTVAPTAQVAQSKQDIARATAAGTTTGNQTAATQFDLPRVEQNAAFMLKSIKDLKGAPGFNGIFGLRGALPNIPGTDAADAQTYLDQVKGKTFLEAYNSLKGGGQITEVEGTKAEGAIARLQQAQSADAARVALDDLESVVVGTLDRVRKQAGVTDRPQPQSKRPPLSSFRR